MYKAVIYKLMLVGDDALKKIIECALVIRSGGSVALGALVAPCADPV
jgi:hypothetical protein